MATHFTLQQLGVEPGSITRLATLDGNPPPAPPLNAINAHLGPAPAPTQTANSPASQPPGRGWEPVLKPEMAG